MLNLLSMTVKLKNGRWTAICSDDQEDLAGDRATVELFANFISRAKSANQPPYLSIAHYFATKIPVELKSALGEWGVAGWADSLMVSDGKLIASGTFEQSLLGQKTMMAIAQDQISGSDHEARISIGFTDLQHAHGPIRFVRRSVDQRCPLCEMGKKRTFIDGELVHLAVTRVPINPRSDIKLEEKSMAAAIATMKDDAESIVGDELAEELEKLTKPNELKSAVVQKSEGIDLDALRQLIREEVQRATPPQSPVTPVVEPSQPSEFDGFVADLTTKLKSVTAMAQVDEALAQFGENIKVHVQKSLPAQAPAPVDLNPVMAMMNQMNQQMTALAEGLVAVNQQVAAVTAVVSRSQATPAIGVPPVRTPQLIENPAALPAQPAPNNDLRTRIRQSVGLPQ